MLNKAKEKAKKLNFPAQLKIKNIIYLDIHNKTYDIVLCIRLLNWLDKKDLEKALKELIRISKKHIIIDVRTYNKKMKIKDSVLSLKREIGSWLRGSTTIHKEKDILKLFSSNSLKIEGKTLTDFGKIGDFHYVYHLIKS